MCCLKMAQIYFNFSSLSVTDHMYDGDTNEFWSVQCLMFNSTDRISTTNQNHSRCRAYFNMQTAYWII